MGCITSRGYAWPPKPYRRFVVRSLIEENDGVGIGCPITVTEIDFVWVWPGADSSCRGNHKSPKTDWQYEASPWQENAIKSLEG